MARRQDNRGVAPYARSLRVNQVLRQVVAEELERLADADERLRLVTVTVGRHRARPAPGHRLPELALRRRRRGPRPSAGPSCSGPSAARPSMKRTPQLTFAVDPAVVAGSRVEDVLRQHPRAGRRRRPGRGRRGGRRRPVSPPGRSQVNGLVVVDKEAGWTSHDVVARCRRIFGQKRVGHAGTLDPDATGVLLVGPRAGPPG